MQFIHFTEGAGDPLWGSGSRNVWFVPLAQSDEGTHVSCLHLAKGAMLNSLSLPSESAVLVIQGRASIFTDHSRLDCSGGVGAMLKAHERLRIESEEGAIVRLIECRGLEATDIAISTPQRIAGQTWPGA